MSSLQGKVAIISGASRGVGCALARGLARNGCAIANLDIIPPEASFASIADDFKVATCYVRCDMSDAKDVSHAVETAFKELGGKRLDICVANAGINKNVPFLETAPEQAQNLFNVNALGVYYLAQACARIMVRLPPPPSTHEGEERRASSSSISISISSRSIILIASIASHQCVSLQGSSAYCATKGAVKAMAPPLAFELAKHGIRVNSISPGYVRTNMTNAYPDIQKEWADNETMVKRLAEVEDLQGVCNFLAGDDSRYVTGTDILVDGGTRAM